MLRRTTVAAAVLAAAGLALDGLAPGGLSLSGPAVGVEPAAGPTHARAAADAGSVAPYQRAVSSPAEDSYYPHKGDPTVDALHYDLDLTWRRAARTLRGVTTVDLRVTRDDTALRLDLSGRLGVRRVLLDGSPVGFAHDGDQLVLARAVAAGSRHEVQVTYRGTPGTARGPASRRDIARLGMRVTDDGQLWTMQEPFGAFTWYPVNDHPSDKAMYDVRVDVPGRWVGVSNGELAGRRTTGGRTVTRWTNRDPMASYLLTLAVGPYRAVRQTGPRGLPITHWVPRDAPELATPLLRTPEALRWAERRLGRYPFDRFGTVVTPGDSAMETQTMVTFGRRNYELGSFHVRSVLVHEIVHHWYGNSVTPSDWRDLWMNEGMASYLQARWEDAHSRRPLTRWRWVVRDWREADPWLRQLYGPPGAYRRQHFGAANVYYSTALMWDRLRRRIGGAAFDDLVRAWVVTRPHTSTDRAALVAWWEARSGSVLEDFFDRWLDSPDSPA